MQKDLDPFALRAFQHATPFGLRFSARFEPSALACQHVASGFAFGDLSAFEVFSRRDAGSIILRAAVEHCVAWGSRFIAWGSSIRGRILARLEDDDNLVLKNQSVQVRSVLEGPPVYVGTTLA
jgi:hypothetical protein